MTEALRNAHARGDIETMRKICGCTPDEVLRSIGDGDMEVRGSSDSAFEIYSIDRRFLVPTLIKGRERIPRDEWVDVTGKSERAIERVMLGMMRNMSDDYFLDDVTVQGRPVAGES